MGSLCLPTKLKYWLGAAGRSILHPPILILRDAGAGLHLWVPSWSGLCGGFLGYFLKTWRKFTQEAGTLQFGTTDFPGSCCGLKESVK